MAQHRLSSLLRKVGLSVSTASDIDEPAALLKVKRIFVDSFGNDIISKEFQFVIVSLSYIKAFKVTETVIVTTPY